jgi:hypothetical protein
LPYHAPARNHVPRHALADEEDPIKIDSHQFSPPSMENFSQQLSAPNTALVTRIPIVPTLVSILTMPP